MKDHKISKKLYNIIVRRVPICSVDILFFDGRFRHVLLCKRKNNPLKGVYYSAGGRLLRFEHFNEAAVRKANEELGIVVSPRKLIFGGVLNEIFNKSRHNVNVYYGCVLRDPKQKFRLDSQHSECRWFSVFDRHLHCYIKTKIRNILSQVRRQKTQA